MFVYTLWQVALPTENNKKLIFFYKNCLIMALFLLYTKNDAPQWAVTDGERFDFGHILGKNR
jgi:hypothetical protein